VETAKALCLVWNKPLVAVNHMYAHIAANFYNNKIKFPAVCLVVSGGHTELIYLKSYWQYEKIGQTVDDAVGEAFDKVAKLLGLGYPGGPVISAMAEVGSEVESRKSKTSLPRPMVKSNNFNFSFSGLKTAVLYTVNKMSLEELKERTPEICFEFQQAVIDVLVHKTMRAAREFKAKTIMLAGGVAANKQLRQALRETVERGGFDFLVPEFKLCTDNAAMTAIAAYYLSQKKKVPLDNYRKVIADPNWELI
jgi:N6-L-threonylcarbamoyladenine synthase